MFFNLIVVKTSVYKHTCLFFRFGFALRALCKLCLLYQGRETLNLLRNKTKMQKLLVPEPYTYKLGIIAAKSIEKLLIMKEMITWLCVQVKFFNRL